MLMVAMILCVLLLSITVGWHRLMRRSAMLQTAAERAHDHEEMTRAIEQWRARRHAGRRPAGLRPEKLAIPR